MFYELTKFQCLINFTSWDIGQYVYGNIYITIACFLGCDVINLILSFKSSRFSSWPTIQDKKFKYLENEKSF